MSDNLTDIVTPWKRRAKLTAHSTRLKQHLFTLQHHLQTFLTVLNIGLENCVKMFKQCCLNGVITCSCYIFSSVNLDQQIKNGTLYKCCTLYPSGKHNEWFSQNKVKLWCYFKICFLGSICWNVFTTKHFMLVPITSLFTCNCPWNGLRDLPLHLACVYGW